MTRKTHRSKSTTKRPAASIGGVRVKLGQTVDIGLHVTDSVNHEPIVLPTRIVRAKKRGPTVFITGALHGDELNGMGIVRQIILDQPFELVAGTLILIPVVNILGFERHTRYLPDRRDLNRCFPGRTTGSLASRFARAFFEQVVKVADYGIDLHTAAIRRTNFPNIRGDVDHPEIRRIAEAFGCELIVNSKGPQGSLRRAAVKQGCATVILEAGEVWKAEPSIIELAIRGIRNVLIELGMVEGEPVRPYYQAYIDKTRWLRADDGGILQFHVRPGDIVEQNAPIATCANLLGAEANTFRAPRAGIILGMTTMPSVNPGDPVCHLAVPRRGIKRIREALRKAPDLTLHNRVRDDLATNVNVTEHADS